MTTIHWVILGSALILLGGGSWLRTRFLVVTVQGQSMAPTLQGGDRLLVRRHRLGRLRSGQVVVVDRPPDLVPVPGSSGGLLTRPETRVVKRVAAVGGEPFPVYADEAGSLVPVGRVFLVGDNLPASTDSRHYGCVNDTTIVGVAGRRLA